VIAALRQERRQLEQKCLNLDERLKKVTRTSLQCYTIRNMRIYQVRLLVCEFAGVHDTTTMRNVVALHCFSVRCIRMQAATAHP
jgi:hypothetical protein